MHAFNVSPILLILSFVCVGRSSATANFAGTGNVLVIHNALSRLLRVLRVGLG